jgi:hypothetical protein
MFFIQRLMITSLDPSMYWGRQVRMADLLRLMIAGSTDNCSFLNLTWKVGPRQKEGTDSA